MDHMFVGPDARQETHDIFNEFVRHFDLIDSNADQATRQASRARIQEILGPTVPPLQQEIDRFTFVIPRLTHADTVRLLGTQIPKQGVHYKDNRESVYFNTNAVCYSNVDVPVYSQRQLRVWITTHPNATQAERATELANIEQAAHLQNDAAAAAIPVWELIQKDTANNSHDEDALLAFTDTKHKQPDWFKVMKNLKESGEKAGYTLQHYRKCIDRFISYFTPELTLVTETMETVDLAKFLMTLTVPEPQKERLTAQMQKLVRHPGQKLRAVISTLHAYAKGFYADYADEERNVLTTRVMIAGIINFTTGKTKDNVNHNISYSLINNRKIEWTVLLETAIKSERVHGEPTTKLEFSTTDIANTPMFHSTFMPVDFPVDSDISSVGTSLSSSPTRRSRRKSTGSPSPVRSKPTKTPTSCRPPAPAPQEPRRSARVQEQQQRQQLQEQHQRTPPPQRSQENYSTPAETIRRETGARKKSKRQTRSERKESTTEKSEESQTSEPSSRNSSPETPRTSDRLKLVGKTLAKAFDKLSTNTLFTKDRSTSRESSPAKSIRSTSSTNKKDYDKNKDKRRSEDRNKSSSNYNNRQNSRDRQRYDSRNRNSRRRDRSSENRKSNRDKSPYRPSSSSSRYRYRTPESSRNRSYSRDKYDRNKSPGSYRSSRYSNRSKSPRQSRQGSSSRSNNYRQQSPSQRYTGFMPGINCSPDYNPKGNKHCSKCVTMGDHHEFACPKYLNYCTGPCYHCKRGNHFANACLENLYRRSSSPAQKQIEYNPGRSKN